MDPLSLLNPIGLFMGAFMMVGAHTGDSDRRHEARLLGHLVRYRCHQENFADVHTDAYRHSLAVGHNPGRPRTSVPRVSRVYR